MSTTKEYHTLRRIGECSSVSSTKAAPIVSVAERVRSPNLTCQLPAASCKKLRRTPMPVVPSSPSMKSARKVR